MASVNEILDSRVLRTRKLIESSFLEMLEEEDFQSITVQDITNRATITQIKFGFPLNV